jgi:hypothetical protein
MKADQNLINMAKQVAESKGYNDIGDIIDKRIGEFQKNVEDSIQFRIDENNKQNEEVKKHYENMAVPNMEKVPSYLKEQAVAKTKEWRNQYGELAREITKLEPSDPAYGEKVAEMNAINSKFTSFNESLLNLVKFNATELENSVQGTVSNANNVDERRFRTNIVTGAAEALITDEGNLQFKSPTGEYKDVTQLGSLIKVNSVFQKDMTSFLANAAANKQSVGDNNKDLLKIRIGLMLGNNPEDIKSAATDSLFTDGDPIGITDELLNDPARIDELKEMVIDFYATTADSMQKMAYDTTKETLEDKKKLDARYRPKDKTPSFNELIARVMAKSTDDSSVTPDETPEVKDPVGSIKSSVDPSTHSLIDKVVSGGAGDLTDDEAKKLRLELSKPELKNYLMQNEQLTQFILSK